MGNSGSSSQPVLDLDGYSLSSQQASRIRKALQQVVSLPTPRLALRLLGEPLQKSYVAMTDYLRMRAAQQNADSVDPVAHLLVTNFKGFTATGWNRNSAYQAVRVLQAFFDSNSENGDVIALADNLHILAMHAVLATTTSTGKYQQQLLQKELRVLPPVSLVKERLGGEAAVSFSRAAELFGEELFQEHVARGVGLPWTRARLSRILYLLQIAASPKTAARAYQRFLQNEQSQTLLRLRLQRIKPQPDYRQALQYGIFRINLGSDTSKWVQRVGAQRWSNYSQFQLEWETQAPVVMKVLPAKTEAFVTQQDFDENEKRLKSLFMKTTPGYPQFSQPNVFFPYDTTPSNRRYDYALAVADWKQLNCFIVKPQVPSWEDASVMERVETVWRELDIRGYLLAAPLELAHKLEKQTGFSRDMQQAQTWQQAVSVIRTYLGQQSASFKLAYPAELRGTPFPAHVNKLDYTLDRLQLSTSNLSPAWRQWTAEQLSPVKTVEEAEQFVQQELQLDSNTTDTDTLFRKYVQVLDSLQLEMTQDTAHSRFQSLSKEQKLALLHVKTGKDAANWLRGITNPKQYRELSPSDKWAAVIQLGLAQRPIAEQQLRLSYNQLRVSDIVSLAQTQSLEEGIAWAERLVSGGVSSWVSSRVSNQSVSQVKSFADTTPDGRVSCKLDQRGRCQWYLNQKKVSYNRLLMLGFSDTDLQKQKERMILQKKSRVPNRPVCYHDGRACHWTFQGQPVTEAELHQLGYSPARLTSLKKQASRHAATY